MAARTPTPKEVVAREDCALFMEDRLTASSACPRHNPCRGWGCAAFTQGSLRRQPWAIFLNTVGVPGQKTCRRIDQTPDTGLTPAEALCFARATFQADGVPLSRNVRRVPRHPSPGPCAIFTHTRGVLKASLFASLEPSRASSCVREVAAFRESPAPYTPAFCPRADRSWRLGRD